MARDKGYQDPDFTPRRKRRQRRPKPQPTTTPHPTRLHAYDAVETARATPRPSAPKPAATPHPTREQRRATRRAVGTLVAGVGAVAEAGRQGVISSVDRVNRANARQRAMAALFESNRLGQASSTETARAFEKMNLEPEERSWLARYSRGEVALEPLPPEGPSVQPTSPLQAYEASRHPDQSGAAYEQAIFDKTALGRTSEQAARYGSVASGVARFGREFGIGPEASKMARGEPFSPAGAAFDMAILFLRPIQALRGIAAGARAGSEAFRAGRGVATATRLARHEAGQVYRGPGLIMPHLAESRLAQGAARKLGRQRIFRVGDLEHPIPAARSGPGRLFERATDAIRDHVPVLASTEERAGREVGFSAQNTKRLYEAVGTTLHQVSRRLNDAQQYALRLLSENTNPLERAAWHAERARVAEDVDTRTFHAIHADMAERASKFLTGESGYVKLANDAPAKLRRAYEALATTGATREQLYRMMGRLSDEAIANRASAPARVLKGARWREFEAEANRLLDAHPTYQAMTQGIRERFADDPLGADSLIAILRSRIRNYAEHLDAQNEMGPEVVTALLDHVAEFTTNPEALQELLARGPDALLQEMLFAPEGLYSPVVRGVGHAVSEGYAAGTDVSIPVEIDARRIASEIVKDKSLPLPPGIKTTQALTRAIERVYRLAQQGDYGRDWYDRAAKVAQDVAGWEGFTPDQVAQVIAIYSQASNTITNMNFVVKALRAFKEKGTTAGVGRFPQRQHAEVDSVLKGGTWEGRKRSSFYANIVESIDPERYAREFGSKPVTVDRWVVRMFLPKSGKDVPGRHYDAMEQVIIRMAEQMGWEPKEVQAAAWVAIKEQSLRERFPHWSDERVRREAADAYEIGRDIHGAQTTIAHEMGLPEDVRTMGLSRKIHRRPVAPEEQYGEFLNNVVRQFGKPEGRIGKGALADAENRAWAWIAAHPDDPLAQKLTDAYMRHVTAHNSPDPDLLFQGVDPQMLEAAAVQVRFMVAQGAEEPQAIDATSRVFGVPVWALQKASHEHAVTQRILSNAEVWRIPEHLAAAKEPDGGFTLSRELVPYEGGGYSVAIAGHEDVLPAAELTEDDILDYHALKAPLMAKDASLHLGGWHDPDDGQFYFDLAKVILDRHAAFVYGRETGQKAIFNFQTFQSESVADYFGEDVVGLAQRGGALPTQSPYGIKGAVEILRDDPIVRILIGEHGDIGTVLHEFAGHLTRLTLNDPQAKRVAKWAGAKWNPETEVYDWSREAEEKFADGMMAFVMRGQGPAGIKPQFRTIANRLRDYYDVADLPDVPPHVATFMDSLFGYTKLRGGRLVGAEDIKYGRNYVPYARGVPFSRNNIVSSTGAFIRHSLFSGGRGRAIGAGPEDQALVNAFTGSLLLSGFFKLGATEASVDSLKTATRLSAAWTARKQLLDASRELPHQVDDVAIKVDPSKGISEDAKALFAKLQALEQGGERIDLSDVNFDLVDEATRALLPSRIEGVDAVIVAREALMTQEPVPNIRWIPRAFVHASGFMAQPSRAALSPALATTRAGRLGLQAAGLSLDMANDIQRALVLHLNPAYIPMNLGGNLVMNLFHQGPLMGVNLWKSAMLHRTMNRLERNTIDSLMGHGLIGSHHMASILGKAAPFDVIAHYANIFADLIPRRAAFLHEARRAGIKKTEQFEDLFARARGGDTEAQELVDQITRRAKDAIVDFDRLTPFERETITRWIWFYPWIKGATRYTQRFVLDHPYAAVALYMMYEHAQAAAEEDMGDRPGYAQLNIPISTDAVGLKIPGGPDVDLSQFAGEHSWMDPRGYPMTFSLRQAFTMTTPAELATDIWGFLVHPTREAGLRLSGRLTPVYGAGGTALFGYDPFQQEEVEPGLGTFLSALTEFPAGGRLRNVIENKGYEDTGGKVYPRTREQDFWRVVGGSLAPTPYNTVAGQKYALSDRPVTPENAAAYLADEARIANYDPPGAEEAQEFAWKVGLDQRLEDTAGEPYKVKLAVAAQYVAEVKGDDRWLRYTQRDYPERAYKRIYDGLRESLYPHYAAYNRQLTKVLDAAVEGG